MVILSQRLQNLQDVIACFLMYMQVWPLSKMQDQWLLYLQDQVVEGLGSFLSGCLMQLAKYTIHNHCLFSLSATRVTTLWLKHQFVFAVWSNWSCSKGWWNRPHINHRWCLAALSDFGCMLSIGAICFEDKFCASIKGLVASWNTQRRISVHVPNPMH